MAAQTERQCFHTMLRNYQHNIKQSLISEWERHCSIMVQMPTGTGKTHLLASLVNDELRTRNEESCVWIVAHRRELVEQIEATVSRYGVSKEGGSVKVLSIQWLSRHWDDVKNEKPGLIVIDECFGGNLQGTVAALSKCEEVGHDCYALPVEPERFHGFV